MKTGIFLYDNDAFSLRDLSIFCLESEQNDPGLLRRIANLKIVLKLIYLLGELIFRAHCFVGSSTPHQDIILSFVFNGEANMVLDHFLSSGQQNKIERIILDQQIHKLLRHDMGLMIFYAPAKAVYEFQQIDNLRKIRKIEQKLQKNEEEKMQERKENEQKLLEMQKEKQKMQEENEKKLREIQEENEKKLREIQEENKKKLLEIQEKLLQ